jgi:hypothetical protein
LKTLTVSPIFMSKACLLPREGGRRPPRPFTNFQRRCASPRKDCKPSPSANGAYWRKKQSISAVGSTIGPAVGHVNRPSSRSAWRLRSVGRNNAEIFCRLPKAVSGIGRGAAFLISSPTRLVKDRSPCRALRPVSEDGNVRSSSVFQSYIAEHVLRLACRAPPVSSSVNKASWPILCRAWAQAVFRGKL